MQITVNANPRSRENKIEKISENEFNISVTAPPVKGLANKQIIELLSNYFNTPKSLIVLKQGFSSRVKVFDIG